MANSSRLWLCCVLVSACAAETPPAVVDHGDGTYSLPAPDGLDATTTVREGALTWSYVGQARHSWLPQPLTELSYVTGAPAATSDQDRILGMIREDADGSRWKVTAVDMPMVRDLLAEDDARSIEVARGLTSEDPLRAATAVEPAGERRIVTTHSWSGSSCDNHYWMGDDDRVAVSPTGSPRRKAIVRIGRVVAGVSCPYDGDYIECLDHETVDWCKRHVLNCDEQPSYTVAQCTGVILRQQWVLTAAHCLHDANLNPLATSSIKVLRVDGVTSSWLPIASKFIDAGFENDDNFDPTDDWALVKLSAPLAEPFYQMNLSSASDSTLDDLGTVANYAYPSSAPNCSPNTWGMWMNNVGELGAVYSNKVNFKIDGGPGHSGSPVFYCPDGDGDDECEDDEIGFVVSVWAGWDGFETTHVGAKAAEQRPGALAIMSSN